MWQQIFQWKDIEIQEIAFSNLHLEQQCTLLYPTVQ